MNAPRSAQLAALHAAPVQAVLAVAGGGSLAISDLLTTPGASHTVLEAVVPYSAAALRTWLGSAPAQACSSRTARDMAMRAFEQARRLAPGVHVAGVAATCSLASDRPKRGEHRVHLAAQTAERTLAVSLTLQKDARARAEEERLAADLLLNVLAEVSGAGEQLPLTLHENEIVQCDAFHAPASWQALLEGETAGTPADSPPPAHRPRLVFPGAFNPLHAGHCRMAALALQQTRGPLALEISIENVDKQTLDYLDLRDRAAAVAAARSNGRLQLPSDVQLWLTRTPTFAEKSALFPQATFVVGADTIARIDQTRYYNDSADERAAAIALLAQRGCRFLVFGRLWQGRFAVLDDLALGADLRALCTGVPESEFAEHVSSTEMRAVAELPEKI